MILVIFRRLKVRGIALYPFVLLRDAADKQDPVLINHERIHLRQQIELLIIPFYTWYLINYLYNLIQHPDHQSAYRNIIFEQEAYDHQHEQEYLGKRRMFAFLDYL